MIRDDLPQWTPPGADDAAAHQDALIFPPLAARHFLPAQLHFLPLPMSVRDKMVESNNGMFQWDC